MTRHSPRFEKLCADTKKRVRELTVDNVKAKLDRKETFYLVDVREEDPHAPVADPLDRCLDPAAAVAEPLVVAGAARLPRREQQAGKLSSGQPGRPQ